MLLLVNILFFVKKNAVKRSAPCEYKKSTVVGSLQKFPIKTRYKIIYGTAVPQAAGQQAPEYITLILDVLIFIQLFIK